MKNLFQTIIGSLQGLNNEGSGKRMTAMYFTVILLTSLIVAYEYGLYVAVRAQVPTSIHISIIEMYTVVNYSLLITVWLLLGLATIETITHLIQVFKGQREDKNDDVKQDS